MAMMRSIIGFVGLALMCSLVANIEVEALEADVQELGPDGVHGLQSQEQVGYDNSVHSFSKVD